MAYLQDLSDFEDFKFFLKILGLDFALLYRGQLQKGKSKAI